MKTINFIRSLSILSYLLIILSGQMIGIPFIGWLLFMILDIGKIDQIFAALGILGVILNFTKYRNKPSITILSFILMLSPLISRMVQVSIESFDYAAFKIPLFIFIAGYIAFIILNTRNKNYKSYNPS